MKNKHCPICGSESWAYDQYECGTGWTFCGNCFQSARKSGLFSKIERAIQEARDHHERTKIVEVK